MKVKQDSRNQKKGLLRNIYTGNWSLQEGSAMELRSRFRLSSSSLDGRVKEHYQAWALLGAKCEAGT